MRIHRACDFLLEPGVVAENERLHCRTQDPWYGGCEEAPPLMNKLTEARRRRLRQRAAALLYGHEIHAPDR
jgi:hypothetical protein